MLDKLFKDSTKKFVAALPDAQDPEVAFAPAIIEKTEDGAAPDADVTPENVGNDSAAEVATEATKATPAAPVAAASSSAVRDLITSAVKEASVSAATTEEPTAEASAPSNPTFAESYLVNAGNKSDRRRPGKSMAPFMDIAGNMK